MQGIYRQQLLALLIFMMRIVHLKSYIFQVIKNAPGIFFAKCILDIAKKHKLKVTEKIHPIKTIKLNQKASRPMHSVLSNIKINSEYNIESSNWMNGIERSMNFLLKNYE